MDFEWWNQESKSEKKERQKQEKAEKKDNEDRSKAMKGVSATLKAMQAKAYSKPPQNASSLPCYFYMLGNCQYGKSCTFSHDKGVIDKYRNDPKTKEALQKIREKSGWDAAVAKTKGKGKGGKGKS